MPDRHRLHLRQVDLGLDGKEAIDLRLGRKLGGELLEVDGLRGRVDLHFQIAIDDVLNNDYRISFDEATIK